MSDTSKPPSRPLPENQVPKAEVLPSQGEGGPTVINNHNTQVIILPEQGLSLDMLKAIDAQYPDLNFGEKYLGAPFVEAEHRRNEEKASRILTEQELKRDGWRIFRAQVIVGLLAFLGLTGTVYLAINDHDWIAGGLLGGLGTFLWKANIFGNPGSSISEEPTDEKKDGKTKSK